MQRREFLKFSGGLGIAYCLPLPGASAANMPPAAYEKSAYDNLLVMVELKGGNDSLNMAIPYADPLYYRLRPQIAIARDKVLQLDQNLGFHPGMAALMPLWKNKELAVVRGLGYPAPNLSHFRSIEIWDTASNADQFLQDGWLSRTFAAKATPALYSADAVVIGSSDLGPMAGGARTIALANTEQFLNNAKLAQRAYSHGNPSLNHLFKVEADIVRAAEGLRPPVKRAFTTVFPKGTFGNVVKTAAEVVANGEQTGKRVAVLRLTIGNFDTHQNQNAAQAALLTELAEGLAALKSALVELQRWDRSLILTYAEFGRRPAENLSGGTDHGTVSTHLVLGGRVRGGLHGPQVNLGALDGSGNLPFALDFRRLYATVLGQWWGVDASAVLHGKFAPLDLLRA